MNRDIIARTFGSHDGRFHADEVTACALLLIFNCIDPDKIYRTRDKQVLDRCEYVCDVGGFYNPDKKLFDHHQVDYTGHLSSAGMILKYLKDVGVISSELFNWLDLELVHGVDAYDNGKELLSRGVSTFSHVIANYCPISYEATKEDEDRAFREALAFTLGHIGRLIERFNYTKSCREIVKETMEKALKEGKKCLDFDVGIPWIDSFFEMDGLHHPAQFVIMPAGSHWKLRGIPPTSEDRMKVRLPLPLNWAGLLDEELKNATGIQGAIFCHKGRFISVWQTKEDAKRALNLILQGEC